ncbi:synaptonemal complex protein 3 isoform X1 [Denticeps clupeoides]|uniref:synaptonemal complex protein 3 isoform X1 n=1 Tax=Denticeps clupeoides TaxID=299321 RepID=UPI0010A3FEB8|nr:synaptonemal complex protein 3 isoform X1 [Denticeps clupeoides]
MSRKNVFLGQTGETASTGRRKRCVDVTSGEDLKSIMGAFGVDLSGALLAKRKRFQTFSSTSVKACRQKVARVLQSQQKARSMCTEEFSAQLDAVYHQWQSDVQTSREQGEKLKAMFQHQQKMFQHMRAAQGQRLKSLKCLLDQYIQQLGEFERTHSQEQEAVLSELRQEMVQLHEKLLLSTQQQEMASVRRCFYSKNENSESYKRTDRISSTQLV